jgi:hypothetical protein
MSGAVSPTVRVCLYGAYRDAPPVHNPLAVQHSVLPVSSHNVSSAICPSQRTIIPSAATVRHVNHVDSLCPVPATVS